MTLCLRRALEIAPQFLDAWVNLGITFYSQQRYNEAEFFLRKALQLQPGHAQTYPALGETLHAMGKLEEAVAVFRSALAIKPDSADVLNNLGNTLRELGKLTEAEACYRQVLQYSPGNVVALCNLGLSLQGVWCNEEAQSCYNRLKPKMGSDASITAAATGMPVTALFPFGRSGSLFLHSLLDGHPQIRTLPGVYLKGWFGLGQWQRIAPNDAQPEWREHLTQRILEEYQPLFDARCTKNVPGKPMDSKWLARDLGFTEMGVDRSRCFEVDQGVFAEAFLTLLKPLPMVNLKDCFELIHRAFEMALRGGLAWSSETGPQILYHLHNPDPYELTNFLHHYPEARLLHIVRNPVQSMESWMLMDMDGGQSMDNLLPLSRWNRMVGKVIGMFMDMRSPFNEATRCRGVRLEDVKRMPKTVMPAIAAWMGIDDYPALYESSFGGLQYWGPTSKLTGKITGFDSKAIDLPMGRILGARDIKIFETLFWPMAHLYGYTALDEADFRRQLAEIRPRLEQPFEFERRLFEQLPDRSIELEELAPYRRLHNHLQQFWQVLDRETGCGDVVPPLRLN